jgi:hypothetical protein
MHETCRLCRTSAELRNSHIIPAFVGRWIKSTSAAGVLRNSEVPNRPVQDTLKRPLLCGSCEGRFGVWERAFTAKVFRPWHDQKPASGGYGPWLARFLLSLAWRVAVVQSGSADGFPIDPDFDGTLEHWRRTLLSDDVDAAGQELHLVFFNPVLEVSGGDLPDRFNHYLLRSTGFRLASNGSNRGVFVKLPGMAIWAPVHPARARFMTGTRIRTTGTLRSRQRIGDAWFTSIVLEQATAITRAINRRSPEQVAKARTAMTRDLNKTKRTGTWLAGEADALLRRSRGTRTQR